jgi:hypothetical protein
MDLDSHADTCCVGDGVMIVNETLKTVKATPFLKSLGSVTNVPIITAAVAYDDPRSGKTFVFLIHQALLFKGLKHCLLCPMQMRLNDVVVNERPKFLSMKPTEEDHAIVCGKLLVPLELAGVTSYFPARKPTKQEYNDCERIELTYPEPEWAPNDVWYSEEEDRFVHEDGSMTLYERKYTRQIFACQTFSDDDVVTNLQQYVLVDYSEHEYSDTDGTTTISAIETKTRFVMSPEELSRMWGIGLLAAKRTLEATTQKAVRTVGSPNVERRWPTGDRPLRYKRLNCQVYHDTLKASVASLRGNKYSEIYATDFGWSRNFPMKKESFFRGTEFQKQ